MVVYRDSRYMDYFNYGGWLCMAVKICERIGICRTDEDGNIVEL